MIGTAQAVIRHSTPREREIAMRAAVRQRGGLARGIAKHRNRLARNRPGERSFGELFGSAGNVPVSPEHTKSLVKQSGFWRMDSARSLQDPKWLMFAPNSIPLQQEAAERLEAEKQQRKLERQTGGTSENSTVRLRRIFRLLQRLPPAPINPAHVEAAASS